MSEKKHIHIVSHSNPDISQKRSMPLRVEIPRVSKKDKTHHELAETSVAPAAAGRAAGRTAGQGALTLVLTADTHSMMHTSTVHVV